MSVYIDKKYINLVSSMLPKLKWKKDTVANCRCILCGDSEKSKGKARGYFFVKDNNFFYKCHNCGVGLNVYGFLQNIAPALCKEYSLEVFCSIPSKREDKKEAYLFEPRKPKTFTFQYLHDLPEDHKAIGYVRGRRIPENKWSDIGYTSDISKLAEEFDDGYKNRFSKEDRLVVVIRNSNSICGFQCRTFQKKPKGGLKYFTLKREQETCYYGMHEVDTQKKFYVLEGPINSMFLPNALATLGSSNFMSLNEKLNDTNAVYIIDNEPYKIETVSILQKLIDSGKNVCIFPKQVYQKDINDMVLSGLDVQKIIDDNTYSGLKAKLVFNKWKKVNI